MGGRRREIENTVCARRKLWVWIFGQGFDSPHLHHIINTGWYNKTRFVQRWVLLIYCWYCSLYWDCIRLLKCCIFRHQDHFCLLRRSSQQLFVKNATPSCVACASIGSACESTGFGVREFVFRRDYMAFEKSMVLKITSEMDPRKI